MTIMTEQKYKGTLVDRAVREHKIEAKQDLCPTIYYIL